MGLRSTDAVLRRELDYHEALYGGFAQQHFARPAVRALRRAIVGRILRLTRPDPATRVLSLGCGIGDTELLLAPHVAEVVGVDLSPAAVRQARLDAARAGVSNARFLEGSFCDVPGTFDLVIAIFFLHHLPDSLLASAPGAIARSLRPGGLFYTLDPSSRRLSGAVGKLLLPRLMEKYRSPDERELDPGATTALFARAGFSTRTSCFDFISSPLAGLFPGWRTGYRFWRWADNLLLRVPFLSRWGSNFEILAQIVT